jgi:hypothetical protein
MSEFINLILANREAKYFSREGWTLILSEARLICPTGSLPTSPYDQGNVIHQSLHEGAIRGACHRAGIRDLAAI